MKEVKQTIQYFFVDEAGDPVFYNQKGQYIVGQEGCSKILLLGFIRIENPENMRKGILRLRDEIAQDKYLAGIPSIQKTLQSFHAKDDCPEVREKMFKFVAQLDFKAEFIVARKIEKIFKGKHKGKPNLFYDDLIIKLFENKLHGNEKNIIYFAVRGNKTRQEPLEEAVQTAINTFETKWGTSVNTIVEVRPQSPIGEPCLQVVDYMNWAVQRAFTKKEDRFLNFVADKISYLVDLYDFDKYPKNFYNRKSNQFSIQKISPL
ncbi:MAG: hypothetical protein CO042_03260 [Parcubacteria group bacterium CG_4_9_14_0_2_um_filter_41_8]|nr:MAG: hypothetical protein COV79_05120 [Parcubacteria group bacterium CG11_big_fil_rev_8_21_14_0_20_41_14]PIZ81523.1 MAG: hypothetical protein COY02_01600 [Parcubacteria group bacterium CG_4_10_14_0_2_um_filter_41_6]PJC40541.1 MAG: hypothetical protein CO042_03260 [Parcubacteria group bacterium CG_4_9_14_0_2_um_filter_41_8]